FGSNEFLGWYTDPVGGEKIDFANWDASVIPEDIDVYHLNFNQNMQIYELDKISDTDSTYHFKVYAHWTRGTGNTGESINAKLKQITGQDGAIVQTENTTIKSFERSNEMPADEYLTDNYKISGNDSNFPIYAWFDSETGTMYYYTADERPMLNADSSDMFANMTGLEKVDLSGFDGYLDKTDSMFENCSSLKTIYATDKIRFNQNATSENMFTGCNALIGGNGTKVTSTDNTNAKLDRPDAQGYFSLKFINFDAGEGAFADGSKFTRRSVVDQDNLVGTAFDESKVEKPTKPGYVLKEWNTKADGTGESLNDINLSTQSVSKDLFSLLAQAWDSSSVPSGNTSYEYDVFAIYKLTPADAELTSDSTYMTAESGFGSGKVDINQVWTGKIKTIAEGYTMPDSITVKVGNTTLSDGYTYNKSTGEITVDAEHTTGKISITAVAVAPKYDVSLTNDSSNITGGTGFGANGATFNAEWNGSIYGSNGHGVPETIIVTVNGNELAASDYSYDNKTGAIKIPGNKITGPITIKAVGVETTASNMFSTGSQAKDAQGGIDVYIPVTKVMEMNDKDATILNDYTFTMTPGTVAHTQDAYQGTTSPAPTDNSVIVKADGFNNIHELTDGKKTVASNTDSNTGNTTDTFVVHFNKDQIGQFHYTVVENPIDGLQSGITMDTNKYDVVVTINYENAADINSGNVRCEGVTVTKLDANGNAIGKTAENESSVSDRGGAGADIQNVVFTNRFHTANVLVDKTVNGSLGDKTRDFTFTFNVTGTGIPTTYKLYKTNAANETAEAVDVQNGSTFTLKHGESAKVMGLPEGAHYSIVETGVADYTTNINASLGDEQYNQYHTLNYHNGSPYAFGTNGDALPNAPASTGSEGENIAVSPYSDEWMSSGVAITANSNLDEHHFTNTKGQLIPTGLIENVTSFLGLALVVALAIAYVLYSRRKGTTKA
ncbi:MAG: hypothetical protein IJH61_06630, partial [Eubacteriaceae bacterium]|nr:hypothetical protein [Eubacteriaceae bacterium]